MRAHRLKLHAPSAETQERVAWLAALADRFGWKGMKRWRNPPAGWTFDEWRAASARRRA